MNPSFVASSKVHGADADLVVDNRLIDLKTTTKPRVPVDYLRQLAGYTALIRVSGIRLGKRIYRPEIRTVEIYYARYGELVRWRLEELFPGDGFDLFYEVFCNEITDDQRRSREWMSRYKHRQLIGSAKLPREVLRIILRYKSAIHSDADDGWLRDAIFETVQSVVKRYGRQTKRKRKRGSKDIWSWEAASIQSITSATQLLQIFLTQKTLLSGPVQDERASAIRRELLRAARRIVSKDRPTK